MILNMAMGLVKNYIVYTSTNVIISFGKYLIISFKTEEVTKVTPKGF